MTGRFNRHEWRPTRCYSRQDVENFLRENGVFGKPIRGVSVIGMAINMEYSEHTHQVRQYLVSMGVPYELIDSGKYPNIDKTPFPCEVQICEPVVLLLEGGTTLEMRMRRDGGLELAVDQIAPNMQDGLNRSNFCAGKLFQSLEGCSLRSVRMLGRLHVPGKGLEKGSRRKFVFHTDGDNGFFLEIGLDSWFVFGLHNNEKRSEQNWEPLEITYGEFTEAERTCHQIMICDGHDGGSSFWIMPVMPLMKRDGIMPDVVEYEEEEISMDEDDVACLLYSFLLQFYRPEQQEPYRNIYECSDAFEWYLEHNVFSYDSIRKMLEVLRNVIYCLREDIMTPDVDKLRRRWRSAFYTSIVIDFYERFCDRMERMMDHAPEYHMISFMGP